MTVIITGLLAGCSDHVTDPRGPVDPSFAMVDGARGGDARFFFLPPLVPAPTYSGVFDATQSPVVQICELAGTTCGATVATFSGAAVKLDVDEEAYRATWKTKDAGLDPAKTYRIRVLIGTSVLGHADVVVVANGSQIKVVDSSQFVPVIDGQALNIRFRIEQAAPPPPPPPPPPPCTPGVFGCGWQDGDVITYAQDFWGDPTTIAGQLVFAHFDAVYFTAGGVLQIGGPITMTFTSAEAIHNYLPSAGIPGALNANVVDPLTSISGQFGGEVAALKLNIDFNAAGHTLGAAGVPLGNLTLCEMAAPYNMLNGISVAGFLALANMTLGGAPSAISILDLALLAIRINGSFEDGVVSQFAQDHLFNGACPPTAGWQNGDVISYSQTSWGDGSAAGGMQLLAHYNAVYPPFGFVEVGIPGVAGHSIVFTSSIAPLDFMPASGPAGPLNADLVDPTSSASGIFGGEVAALRFNIDFSDAGYVLGTANVRFGDLTLRGLTGSLAALNGTSIRTYSSIVNTALGGGATPYAIADLNANTLQVNASFEDGVPTTFAQHHLYNAEVQTARSSRWIQIGAPVGVAPLPGVVFARWF